MLACKHIKLLRERERGEGRKRGEEREREIKWYIVIDYSLFYEID